MLTVPLGKANQLPEPLLADRNPGQSIVLIEPIAASLPDRYLLLASKNYQVTSVRDSRELSLLSGTETFTLALVSDTLGSVGLAEAARSIRKQWPTARILILGQAAVILEDNLYDDALPHSCSPQDLCETLARMSSQPILGRPFLVAMPALEHHSAQRQGSAADDEHLADVSEKMTLMRSSS